MKPSMLVSVPVDSARFHRRTPATRKMTSVTAQNTSAILKTLHASTRRTMRLTLRTRGRRAIRTRTGGRAGAGAATGAGSTSRSWSMNSGEVVVPVRAIGVGAMGRVLGRDGGTNGTAGAGLLLAVVEVAKLLTGPAITVARSGTRPLPLPLPPVTDASFASGSDAT